MLHRNGFNKEFKLLLSNVTPYMNYFTMGQTAIIWGRIIKLPPILVQRFMDKRTV